MKLILKSLLLTLILSQVSVLLFGQNSVSINGQVVSFDKYPLNNVEVTTKKSNNTEYTDSMGFFSIECHKNDRISFNAPGFDKVGIKIKKFKNETINLVYSNRDNSFSQATENGIISEEVLQEAIETNPLKGEKDYSNYTSIYDVIRDEVYTVRVSGQSITTTKQNSFTGSQEVLLVVDGTIVNDISFISPNNVQSIKHLEGAEAAKYGSRGGNGVIEITLKKR